MSSPKDKSPSPPVEEPASILLVADDAIDDTTSLADSAFTSNGPLSTDSLSSSIFAYRTLHGRTYNAHSAASSEIDYWAPNDSRQNDGLDLLHHAMTIVIGDRLFLSPIDTSSPLRVLDLGTGTGCWAIDFADANPLCDVLGTDISPIQPGWVPPNVRFQIDDFLRDWTWDRDSFDFIHYRALYGSVPDLQEHYAKALAHLVPGGWLEDMEMDVEIDSDHIDFEPDHIFRVWGAKFIEVGLKQGKPFGICRGHAMRDSLVAAGFVDVHEVRLKVPVHTWPKDPALAKAGSYCLAALEESLEGYALFGFTNFLGWSVQEVYAFTAKMRSEMRRRSNCGWIAATLVYGRKPE